MSSSNTSRQQGRGPLGKNDSAHPFSPQSPSVRGPMSGKTAGAGSLRSRSTKTAKILGFDARKTRDFLFHVALAEARLQALMSNPEASFDSPAMKSQADARAAALFDWFLEACAKGPQPATQFLSSQHAIFKHNLELAQGILQDEQRKIADRNARLSELAFGAQVVKSTATAALAIGVLFLAPEVALAGALLQLDYDLWLHVIDQLDPSGSPHADAVTIGFGQTMYNDVTGISGELQHSSDEALAAKLANALKYPSKSSTYRAATASASRLNMAMKALGWIGAGVTVITEGSAVLDSYHQMQTEQKAAAQLNSPNDVPKALP